MQDLALVHIDNMVGEVGHVRHPNVSALPGCFIDHGLHLIFEFSMCSSVSVALSVHSRLGMWGYAGARAWWMGQLVGP
jgi:hypothetical protein